jgi:hypothetical protein
VTTLLEASRLALEALKNIADYDGLADARAALRQAIEQAEQAQPAAWQWLDTGTFRKRLPKTAEPGAWNPLYTAPPPRQPWVGLTDEEMHNCWDSPLTPLGMKHVRMVEAKLKEKNT